MVGEQSIAVSGSQPSITYTGVGKKIYEDSDLNLKSPIDGTLENITEDYIMIRGKDGKQLVLDKPKDHVTSKHSTSFFRPTVKIGGKIKAGDVIYEESSFKDKEFALGVPLLCAFTSYKGEELEDGMIISESAAKKFSHKTLKSQEFNITTSISEKNLSEIFSNPRGNVDYDEFGIIKVGKKIKRSTRLLMNTNQLTVPYIVNSGVIKSVRVIPYASIDEVRSSGKLQPTVDKILDHYIDLYKKEISKEASLFDDKVRARELGNEKLNIYNNNKLTSLKSENLIKIVIEYECESPLKLSDKLTHFAGGKGVTAKIVPDNEMFRTEDGRIIDIILSPLSIISRMTTSVIYDGSLCLLAEELWKQLKLRSEGNPHIPDENLQKVVDEFYWYENTKPTLDQVWDKYKDFGAVRVRVGTFDKHYTNKLLKDLADLLNVKFEVKLFDPTTNRWIRRNIRIGKVLIYRLHFFAEDKLYSFGVDPKTGINRNYQLPSSTIAKLGYGKARESINQSQKLDEMSSWVLRATGNNEVIEEVYRSQDKGKGESKLLTQLTLLGLNLNYRRDKPVGDVVENPDYRSEVK